VSAIWYRAVGFRELELDGCDEDGVVDERKAEDDRRWQRADIDWSSG
jgi:hypothetical protein